MSKRIATRKPSGAELRQMRDNRQARPYELQEAGRREASFLKNITGAQDDLEWILTNRAWTQLGFERVADWWDAHIGPVLDGLELKPSAAMVERVIRAIVADEAELPKLQRRTQREIASIARTSQTKVSRSSSDAGASQSDLDGDSGDGGSSPTAASGPNPPDHDGVDRSQVSDPSGAGPISPVGRPESRDASGDVQGSVAIDRPGIDSSLARDGAGEPSLPPAAAEETFDSSAAQNLTEGQVSDPSPGSVLSPPDSGVDPDGDEVEEEPETPPVGSSSTDPASEWMSGLRSLVGTVRAIRDDLKDDERNEAWDGLNTLHQVLFGGVDD